MSIMPWQKQRIGEGLPTSDIDMDAILSACDHALHFAERVIAQSNFSTEMTARLQIRVSHIHRRRTDPNLYVAVVGEFNGGKSTFINALLRQKVLKSSPVVRTAATTRIVYGPCLDFTVLFEGQKRSMSYLNDRGLLRKQLTHLLPGTQLQDDQYTYLHIVTTEEAVTQYVKEITLYHPAKFLQQNIVIIDTPGINAQEGGKELHTHLIQNVVEQEADLAIIIIPAYASLANVLYEFMQSSLKPFLHRCIPILTHMDQIDEEKDRQRILKDAHKRMVEFVGGTKPVHVYDAAAKVVLDTFQNSNAPSPEQQYWSDRFSKLEQTIWELLRYQRTLSIAESLLRLMSQLFKDLQDSLLARQESYTLRERAIQRELPDLEALAQRERQECLQRVSRAIRTARDEGEYEIDAASSRSWSRITDDLRYLDSDYDFKNFMDGTFKNIIEDEADTLRMRLDRITFSMQSDVQGAVARASQHFQDAYQRLAAVAQINLSLATTLDRSDISLDAGTTFSNLSGITAEFERDDNWKRFGGAGVGAAIGTFIVPGFGTIIGGIIGGVFGSMFISAEKKRAALSTKLEPAVEQFFSQVQGQFRQATNTYEHTTLRLIGQQIDTHVARHKAVVATVNRQQKQEAEKLRQLQQITKSDLAQIKAFEATLQQTQQKLARHTFS